MQIIKGNLIKLAKRGQFDAIVQGCNCFCRMGRGIAETIKEELPEAFIADQMTTPAEVLKLGTCSVGRHVTAAGHEVVIFNAYTQYHWNEPENHILVNYSAVRSCMKIVADASMGLRIGIPLIGAGLARGEWGEIERIILEELQGLDVTIVHFDQ